MKSSKNIFTGERMIPNLNKGMTLYYEHLLRYFMVYSFVKNKKVLDVGCGVGYGSWMLKDAGAKSVLGIDISDEAIDYAIENFKSSNIQFKKGDGEHLKNYQQDFDVVVAFEFIEHIKNQERFLLGVKENLKKGGLFFVSSPNKNTYQNENHFHINELTPRQFEALLQKFFKNVLILDQRFLFTNYIIPTHQEHELSLGKIGERFVKKNIESILPINKLDDTRYLVAICSDNKIDLKQKFFSLSAYEVDDFSLKEGVEGLYKQLKNQVEISKSDKELLNQIVNSKFYTLWKVYCLLKKTFLKK